MTEYGWVILVTLFVCIPWWFYENYKQRPLSEFKDLDEMARMFPEDLGAIKQKGSLSRAEHLRYLDRHVQAIKAEIKRRELAEENDTSR